MVMFFNRVFQQERFNRLLRLLGSLIKNGVTLTKCHLFSCGCKKCVRYWHLFRTAFLQKIKVTSKSYDRFPSNLKGLELSSFISPHCKFEVNSEFTTRCTKVWSNYTLKCYAKTFVKVDAQIDEECLRTIFHL